MRAMAGLCEVCGTKLSIVERIVRSRLLCRECDGRVTEAQWLALQDYRAILAALPLEETTLEQLKLLEQLSLRVEDVTARTGLDAEQIRETQEKAFRDYALAALADDRLTRAEERRLFDIAAVFGFDQKRFADAADELQTRLL